MEGDTERYDVFKVLTSLSSYLLNSSNSGRVFQWVIVEIPRDR